MSMPRFEQDADPFSQIVSGITLEVPTSELPTLQVGNQLVRIDGLRGEAFRQRMKKVLLRELSMLGLRPTVRQELSDEHTHIINNALGALLLSKSGQIRAGEQVVVTGKGILAAHASPADKGTEILLLDGALAAIGTLEGVGYGEYPYGDGTEEVDEIIEDGDYAGPVGSGPLILLGRASIGVINEPDQTHEYFDQIIVPFAEPELSFYKAT